ncbi:MAG: uridine kinase family protein [Candidatus Levyibacteriota bacterium]
MGGPASGKGTLAARLAASLGRTAVLSTDNYLKGDRKWRRAAIEDVGKDPLEKYDITYLATQVKRIAELKNGEEVGIPHYDGTTGIAISDDPINIPPDSEFPTKVKGRQDFIIVEGDFQFLEPELLDQLVYLDVADDVRLQNRLHRDEVERREAEDKQANEKKIRDNFDTRQKTQFLPHTLPQMSKADLVVHVSANPTTDPNSKTKYQYSYDLTL